MSEVETEVPRHNKETEGKVRFTFIPFDALAVVARVLEEGAVQYGKNNWRNCQDPEKYIDAALRHLTSISDGEWIDPKSGYPHAAHLASNALFLVVLTAGAKKFA